MAEKDNETTPEDEVQAPPAPSGMSPLKWVAAGVGFFVIAVASQIVAPMITGQGAPAAATAEDGEAVESVKDLPPAIYQSLEPPLVVSFDDGTLVRFLQITVEVMAREQDAIDEVNRHNPVIRNDLLMLFGGQDLTELYGREGKEALRVAARETVQRILEYNTGEPGIEDLYFTSFVVQ